MSEFDNKIVAALLSVARIGEFDEAETHLEESILLVERSKDAAAHDASHVGDAVGPAGTDLLDPGRLVGHDLPLLGGLPLGMLFQHLYLSPRQMRNVLHGDRVLASVIGVDARGRREGAVREILERAHQRIVGHFIEESGIALVVPDDARINQDTIPGNPLFFCS